ncbi:MAG: prepilin-type N-terminal cleavage/methylation domain-containing protein [Candidatus Gastranaerophilales bacterium]|nr:prepilin-type N-terminal cleavage/methylation domain-containing protein [Candidatus Gastranaerophilales bacterium]
MVKKGFTFSEMLVTILIIGIVAAIIIPLIPNIMPSQNKVMFKKAYSTLENTVSELINNSMYYPEEQTALDAGGVTVSRGFNYTLNSSGGYYTNNKFCTLFSDLLNTVGSVSCPAYNVAGTGTFTTTDGVVWTLNFPTYSDTTPTPPAYKANEIFPRSSAIYQTKVIVDVNGDGDPGCTVDTGFSTYSLTQCTNHSDCTDEPDQFIFGIRYDGKITVGSSDSGASTDVCAEEILEAPATFTR